MDVYDPHADKLEVYEEYGIQLFDSTKSKYEEIILVVSQNEFFNLDFDDLKKNSDSILFDIKRFLNRE